jgi:hypothetical protein
MHSPTKATTLAPIHRIPALILALLVAVATIFLWPLAAVVLLYVIYRVFNAYPELLAYIAALIGIFAIAMGFVAAKHPGPRLHAHGHHGKSRSARAHPIGSGMINLTHSQESTGAGPLPFSSKLEDQAPCSVGFSEGF